MPSNHRTFLSRTAVLCVVCAMTANAMGIPSPTCSCLVPDSMLALNPCCDYVFQCAPIVMGEFTVVEDPSPQPAFHKQALGAINAVACSTPCAPAPTVNISHSISMTDTAETHWTGNVGIELGDLNQLCGLKVPGISLSLEYSSGTSSSSSVSVTATAECGGSGVVCREVQYRLYHLRRNVTITVPIYGMLLVWNRGANYSGENCTQAAWAGCAPSTEWQTLPPPCAPPEPLAIKMGEVTVSGHDEEYGCEIHDVRRCCDPQGCTESVFDDDTPPLSSGGGSPPPGG